jgi:hypothetical protein
MFAGDVFEADSAGSAPSGQVNPLAVNVMRSAGRCELSRVETRG